MKSKMIGITGANGILGKLVIKRLKRNNLEYRSFNGDIRSKNDIRGWLSENSFNFIIHLAAIVPTAKVKDNPEKAYAVNVIGTKNLVEEIKLSRQNPWLFYASTSHVYRSKDSPINEDDKIYPVSEYGKTKYEAENMIIEHCDNFCIGRIFSFYHESQKKPFLYPNIKERLEKEDLNKPFELYGDKIKYIRREKDFGPHFCWLEGILNADAEFVHLQFDDDWIDKKFIAKCMKLMRDDVGVVIADAYGMFKFKKIFGKTGVFLRKTLEKRLLKGAMYSPSASFFRKKDLIDALYQGELPVSKYKGYHGVGPDSFMTLLAVLRYKKVGIITDHLVFFREHKGSITCDAHSDPKKYMQLRNAYENVSSYYMFLKWYWLFDKFKYFSFGFWIRGFKRVVRIVLKRLGLFESAKKLIGKIKRVLK